MPNRKMAPAQTPYASSHYHHEQTQGAKTSLQEHRTLYLKICSNCNTQLDILSGCSGAICRLVDISVTRPCCHCVAAGDIPRTLCSINPRNCAVCNLEQGQLVCGESSVLKIRRYSHTWLTLCFGDLKDVAWNKSL